MRPPILVVGDDIELFATAQSAERSLEPYETGATTVCDTDGRRLMPEIVKRGLANVVALRETNEILNESELRSYVIRFLRAHEGAEFGVDLPFDQLWALATRHASK